jgi:hypothetical protein
MTKEMLGPAVLDGEGGLSFKITESSLLQQIPELHETYFLAFREGACRKLQDASDIGIWRC